MNVLRSFMCLLLGLLSLPVFSSCGFYELQLPDVPESPPETEIDIEVLSIPADPFTVVFEENETFRTEAERKAAQRIDSAIRTAVKLLNTIEADDKIPILDCDYDTRPKRGDTLKHPQSKDIYDYILEKVSAFEDYCFNAQDYPGEDFFNLFVSAVDALRIDHTELFLYCDGKIDGNEYRSGYFMPGDWLNKPCNDRKAIRAEVDYCNAVVDRILDKMPAGLSNYEKCCYFVFVLADANGYDYSEDIYLYDYQAYNAFVKGKTICSGYAQAFYRLCRKEGISCWYCRGETPSGHHAWNSLDTESGPVYIDITWYDTEEIGENYRDGKEQYLFMTQEDFDYYGYVQDICQ